MTVDVDGAVHGKFADKLRSHVHGRPWIVDCLNKECRWLLQNKVSKKNKWIITSWPLLLEEKRAN